MRVCVCVCVCVCESLPLICSGGAIHAHADITDDHRDVPASCDVRNHDPILESWRLFQDVVACWNLW